MSSLLINDYPLMVSPKLAARIGLEEAHFLQQVHWLCERSKNIRDGKAWVYNTYEQWVEHFPFWDSVRIGRIVRKLEKIGVLITTMQYNRFGLDKTKWYRVNYASEVLDFSDCANLHVEDANLHVENAEMQPDCANLHVEDANLHVENAEMQPDCANLHVEDANLHEQLPETFNTDLTIDYPHNGNGGAGAPPAAPPAVVNPPETKPKSAKRPRAEPDPDNVRTWQAYARAYRDRYGVLPATNAKTRGQTAQFVGLVGRDVAPELAAFFVWHNGGWFVQCRHDFGCLLKAYQQVLTDMQRGEQMTATKARQVERTQSNYEAVAQNDDLAAWERWQQKQGVKA